MAKAKSPAKAAAAGKKAAPKAASKAAPKAEVAKKTKAKAKAKAPAAEKATTPAKAAKASKVAKSEAHAAAVAGGAAKHSRPSEALNLEAAIAEAAAELGVEGFDIETQKAKRVKILRKREETAVKRQIELAKSKGKGKKKGLDNLRDAEVEPAVIYLAHIPYGFFERQMREYFEQFGTVTRLRLSRSAKTNRSRGYAFIEFKERAVAEIVAETMNNYLLFDRILKCEMVPDEKVHPKLFHQPHHLNYRRVQERKHNKVRTTEEKKMRVAGLAARDRARRKKLADLGIDYDYPEIEGIETATPSKAAAKVTSKAGSKAATPKAKAKKGTPKAKAGKA